MAKSGKTSVKQAVETLTTGQILIDIVDESVHLFHDEYTTGWGRVWGRCYPIRSTAFRRWLEGRFYDRMNKPPNSQAFNDSLNVIESTAIYKGCQYPVNVRSAFLDGKIFIDLAGEDGTVLEISKEGCTTNPAATTYFWRSSGMKELTMPESGGNLDLLRPFLNVESDEDFRLLIAWLFAAYNPSIACPILILQGEQGSAKSTTSKVLRALIDPNEAPIRSQPNDERDIVIMAKNSRVLAFDNLSGLKPALSDALCRICTGGGFSTRKLYTNDEEQIFKFRRPIILNGIDDIATRGDLLDRSIILSLPAIASEQRRDERLFWKEFEKVRPKIIGQLLIGIAHGLEFLDKVKLKKLPRMADFAEWITACEVAFYPDGTLLSDYINNRNQAIETGLDSDYLATAIRTILSTQKKYAGTATELIEKIKAVSPDINERYLPSTRTLKSRLTRLSPALRKIGIIWNRERIENGTMYQLEKLVNNVQDVQDVQKSFPDNCLQSGRTLAQHDDDKSSARNVQDPKSLEDNEYCRTGRTGTKKQEYLFDEKAPF